MTGRKKPDAAGGAGNAQPPTCELTAEEMSWAVRYFKAIRRMDDEAREACLTAAETAEVMAVEFPRHKRPVLRLVADADPRGGAE